MNKQRQYLLGIGCAVVLFLLVVLLGGKCSNKTVPVAPVDTMQLLLHQIQDCSRIYATEVNIHKIVTHNDNQQLHLKVLGKEFFKDIPLSKRKIAIPMDVTLKAYVDLSEFSASNVKRRGNKVEVTLPDPKIMLTHTKLNNENIVRKGNMFAPKFTDEELLSYAAQGRADVVKTIPDLNILPMARVGAARALIPIFEQLGYNAEDITITYRKEFTFGEIQRFVQTD